MFTARNSRLRAQDRRFRIKPHLVTDVQAIDELLTLRWNEIVFQLKFIMVPLPSPENVPALQAVRRLPCRSNARVVSVRLRTKVRTTRFLFSNNTQDSMTYQLRKITVN
eukprot:8797977-Pyramimonas_sp.AAC.1